MIQKNEAEKWAEGLALRLYDQGLRGLETMSEEKELDQRSSLESIYYHEDHAWVQIKGEEVLIGISDFAQGQLGEILFVNLPCAGETFNKGEVFGEAESAKTVSALYAPISCEVLAVNENLTDSPDIVNKDPCGDGWMISVKPRDFSELHGLLSEDEYLRYSKEC